MRVMIVLLLMLPLKSFAQWSTTWGKITDIISHDGVIIIDTELTDGPCGNESGFWWPISDDDSQYMFSLALTAHSAGKKIRVSYNESTPECGWDRAKITHLRLYD